MFILVKLLSKKFTYDFYMNRVKEKINDLGYKLNVDKLKDGIKIKKGKKVYHKVIV